MEETVKRWAALCLLLVTAGVSATGMAVNSSAHSKTAAFDDTAKTGQPKPHLILMVLGKSTYRGCSSTRLTLASGLLHPRYVGLSFSTA